MIDKKQKIFPPGCCLGHYSGKRKECRSQCDIAEFCKKSVSDGTDKEVKKIMKTEKKSVLECLRDLND